jgi:UDP-2-acetamido-2,6-beta-L-arabino-hexul-4-ose reductase
MMKTEVTIEKIDIKKDRRGCVFEPLTAGEIPDKRNVHVVITEPGYVRGNHFHQRGEEILAVRGPALIRLRDGNKKEDLVVPERGVTKISIPPGISHAIQNTGRQSNLLIAFNTLEHDPENPDVIEDILI